MADFDIPEGLCPKGEAAATALLEAVATWARETWNREPWAGGCRAFRSPAEWAESGNEYGHGALLVVVHDGGDMASLLNFDYGDARAVSRQVSALQSVGAYAESCTSWYTAIYSA